MDLIYIFALIDNQQKINFIQVFHYIYSFRFFLYKTRIMNAFHDRFIDDLGPCLPTHSWSVKNVEILNDKISNNDAFNQQTPVETFKIFHDSMVKTWAFAEQDLSWIRKLFGNLHIVTLQTFVCLFMYFFSSERLHLIDIIGEKPNENILMFLKHAGSNHHI